MKLGSLEIASPYLLAPMAGYTDKPFRYMCKTFRAGLTVSELISANAIYYGNKKTELLMEKSDIEKPFSIQLFGSEPDIFLYAAQSIEHKCDCIDINAGCPVSKVIKTHSGSYLLKDKQKLLKIVDTLKRHLKKPISIKLRKGFDLESLNSLYFYKELEERGVDFVVIHPRLRGDFFKGEPDYEHVAQVVDVLNIDVVVSGGIDSFKKLEKVKRTTGCKFFMIGQAALSKPYIFEDFIKKYDSVRNVAFLKNMMKKHFLLMVDYYGECLAAKNFRKFFHQYIKGLTNVKILKEKINNCTTAECVENILEELKTR